MKRKKLFKVIASEVKTGKKVTPKVTKKAAELLVKVPVKFYENQKGSCKDGSIGISDAKRILSSFEKS